MQVELVEDDDAGVLESRVKGVQVVRVVADVAERGVKLIRIVLGGGLDMDLRVTRKASRRIVPGEGPDLEVFRQVRQQCFAVIRDPAARRVERRENGKLHWESRSEKVPISNGICISSGVLAESCPNKISNPC